MSEITLNATLSLNAYERTPVTVTDYEVYSRISRRFTFSRHRIDPCRVDSFERE